MIGRIVLAAAIGFGAASVLIYGSTIGVDDYEIPTIESMAAVGQSGPLDGMEFVGELGPEGKPKDVADVFVFSNGTFVSKECELRCDYPARPYFIQETENEVRFVSKTKCPYKDAEITWYGNIKGNKITGMATWTIRRWYWTVTNNFEFEGTLKKQSKKIAGVG